MLYHFMFLDHCECNWQVFGSEIHKSTYLFLHGLQKILLVYVLDVAIEWFIFLFSVGMC